MQAYHMLHNVKQLCVNAAFLANAVMDGDIKVERLKIKSNETNNEVLDALGPRYATQFNAGGFYGMEGYAIWKGGNTTLNDMMELYGVNYTYCAGVFSDKQYLDVELMSDEIIISIARAYTEVWEQRILKQEQGGQRALGATV